jgi:hypothetical protein
MNPMPKRRRSTGANSIVVKPVQPRTMVSAPRSISRPAAASAPPRPASVCRSSVVRTPVGLSTPM